MDEDSMVVEVEVATRKVAEDDPFYLAQSIRDLEHASLEAWGRLSSEERQALVIVLRDTFVHLMQDIDAWVPASIIVEPGKIQVVLTFKAQTINQKVVALRRNAQENMVSMRDQLVDMRKELVDERADRDRD